MKKILTGLIALSMISSPALARGRDHNRDRPRAERHEGGGCGWLCGAILGAIVVGVASSSRDDRRERDDNRYYPPDSRYDERYCVREQIVEWRNGERYIYWQTTCN